MITMAITVPAAGQPVSATSFGIPVANQLNSIAPTTWTNMTLANGWTNVGGYQAAQYRKRGDMVDIRGTITTGTSGTYAAQLPTGFRPGNSLQPPIRGGFVDITTTGYLTPYTSDPTTSFTLSFSTLA